MDEVEYEEFEFPTAIITTNHIETIKIIYKKFKVKSEMDDFAIIIA